jgi:hypothetical protein
MLRPAELGGVGKITIPKPVKELSPAKLKKIALLDKKLNRYRSTLAKEMEKKPSYKQGTNTLFSDGTKSTESWLEVLDLKSKEQLRKATIRKLTNRVANIEKLINKEKNIKKEKNPNTDKKSTNKKNLQNTMRRLGLTEEGYTITSL